MAHRKPAKRQQVPDPVSIDGDEVARVVIEVRNKLKSAGSARGVDEVQRYYGEPVDCYGIKAVDVHTIAVDLSRFIRSRGLAFALEVADPLWCSGNLEEGMVADEQVNAFSRHVGGSEFERFDKWADSLGNWSNTDALASHLVSRALNGKPSLVRRLLEWSTSSNRWRRRAAAVSFVPLVREGRFLTDALTVAEPLMVDKDEMVQVGVGWLLQEASRLQPDRVVEFLLQWKDECAQLILTMATERMSPEHSRQILSV